MTLPISVKKEEITIPEKRIEYQIINYLMKERERANDEKVVHSIDEILRHLELYVEKHYLFSTDPYIKVISGIFDMVISQEMDPEAIDFVKFSKLFLEKCVDDESVELSTIGKILFLAFKTLNIKVYRKLLEIEALDQEEFEEDYDSFDFLDMEIFQDDEAFEYTQRVITGRKPPIQECVRRGGKNIRKATLLELFEAVKEAEKERREHERRYRKLMERRKALKLLQQKKKSEVSEAPVKDDIYANLKKVWERIREKEREEIYLTELLGDQEERLDTVRTLFAVLFINQKGLVRMVQDVPFGDILLTNIKREEEINLPLDEKEKMKVEV
ncbi:MAG TPA: hypothetical protein EYP29_01090 [Thermoplasmata archaeon]|nr:hypothetical protein [Thermoplasmata archaeon]